MTSPGGQANSTGVPPGQKIEQSWGANLSLYKHWVHISGLNRIL